MTSIVIPSLNERENLAERIPSIYEVCGEEAEVIIVDGESTDDTQSLVEALSGKHERLKYVRQTGKGFANALLEGLKHAQDEVVVTMDAENHDPREIPLLLEQTGEFDIVVGSRFMAESRVSLDAHRLASTKIANRIVRNALNLPVRDTSSGFRAYRKKILDEILSDDYRTQYFSIQVELLEKARTRGARLGEVGVTYLRRQAGESKFNFKPALRDGKKLIEIAAEKKLGKKTSRN